MVTKRTATLERTNGDTGGERYGIYNFSSYHLDWGICGFEIVESAYRSEASSIH